MVRPMVMRNARRPWAGLALLAFLALLLTLAPAAGARIVKGPWIVDVGMRMATIKWESEGTEGRVDFGPNADYGQTVAGVASGHVFSALLYCVDPMEVVHYRVVADGDVSPDGTFVLAPQDPATPFAFAAFGDVRTNHDDHQAVVNAILAEAPDFVIQTGDLVEIALLPSEWQTFFDVERDLLRNVPYLPVMGNHELWGGRDAFTGYFSAVDFAGASQYALIWGNTRLIALDVTVPYGAGTSQFQWMTDQLQAAADDPRTVHTIVFLHYPPYSSSNHGEEADPVRVRNELVPVWEQYGVDLVFSGHDHNYERSVVNGRTYVVTGGGGAPLYDNGHADWTVVSAKTLNYCLVQVDGTQISVAAYDPQGALIDSFVIDQDYGGPGIPGHEPPDPCASSDDDTSADDDAGDDDASDDATADDDLAGSGGGHNSGACCG